MSEARPIGEIAQEIVDKIAENNGFFGNNPFTIHADFAMKKDGPQQCVNTETGLTSHALQERRS